MEKPSLGTSGECESGFGPGEGVGGGQCQNKFNPCHNVASLPAASDNGGKRLEET